MTPLLFFELFSHIESSDISTKDGFMAAVYEDRIECVILILSFYAPVFVNELIPTTRGS